jgi:hypothetical protein
MLGVAGIASSYVQNVYSVNVVGYVNMDLAQGYSMIANQLDNGAGNLVTELVTPAVGTTFYKFNGSSYDQLQYVGIWIGVPTLTLAPGEGAFVNMPSAGTLTFTGEVLEGDLVNPVSAGYDIYSSMVPQEGTLQTLLGYTPAPGESVFQWNGPGAATPYTQSQFVGIWIPSEPNIKVGEAFWLNAAAAKDWARNFTVPREP